MTLSQKDKYRKVRGTYFFSCCWYWSITNPKLRFQLLLLHLPSEVKFNFLNWDLSHTRLLPLAQLSFVRYTAQRNLCASLGPLKRIEARFGVPKGRELHLPFSACSTLLLLRFQSWLHDLQIAPQWFQQTTLECELYSTIDCYRQLLKVNPLFLHQVIRLALILNLRLQFHQFHRSQHLTRYQAYLIYNLLLVRLHWDRPLVGGEVP